NTESDVPITSLDIFPTILHYTGINDSSLQLDGDDLSSILEGRTEALERSLYWHFPIYLEAYETKNENRDSIFRTRPGAVVRSGDWKLHYYFEDGGIELYNLSKDIGERNNLADIATDVRAELLRDLKQWWADTKAPIPTQLNPEYQQP
ncbi:MAG: sulfatase/phosphatase domain-containing protein, partial [Bacteroidota bacterium]